jgi:hypothetical protein
MKGRIAMLLMCVVMVAAVVLSPVVAHTAVAGGGGATSVSFNGTALTITVNIDLCCAPSASAQTIYGPLIQEEVKQAENLWNEGLSKLPAKGCFPIKVVFKVHLLQTRNWEKGYHQIDIDLYKPGRSMSLDYTPGATHNDDTPYVYNSWTDGQFYEPAMGVPTWAHEIGHLMGLGDDYIDRAPGSNGRSKSIPGRGGTMMADHGAIDQALADRLAAIAAKSGLQLPPCVPTPNPCGGQTANPDGAGVCR